MLTEQHAYRELLAQMTRRDLLLRYKQTVMGFGWAIFMPLVNTALFSVIFTQVAPIATPVPYPLFAYCGLAAWNFSASSMKFATTSLTTNPNLVTKVYFPREIFPFSAVLVALADFAVASVVLAGLMAYYGVGLTSTIVLLPAVLAVHIAFTAGMALLLSLGNLFYRDVKYLFDVGLTIWMFATSVLYPIDKVGGWAGVILAMNPMTPMIDGYRKVLLLGETPFSPAFAVAAVLGFGMLFVSWVLFHRAELQFAENI